MDSNFQGTNFSDILFPSLAIVCAWYFLLWLARSNFLLRLSLFCHFQKYPNLLQIYSKISASAPNWVFKLAYSQQPLLNLNDPFNYLFKQLTKEIKTSTTFGIKTSKTFGTTYYKSIRLKRSAHQADNTFGSHTNTNTKRCYHSTSYDSNCIMIYP